MASKTMLNSVGDRGYPWFMLRYSLNGSTKYLMALATMVRRSQYVQRSRIVLRTTPYAVRISRHLSQSRSSYAFWRFKKTSKRTAYLMAISCWSSLISKVEVPAPLPAWNMCSTSWNLMVVASRRFRRLVTVFHSTSIIPIPLNPPLAPLRIRTAVYQVLSSASIP